MKVTTESVAETLLSMGRPFVDRERYALRVLNKRFAAAMDRRVLDKQKEGRVGWGSPDCWVDEAGNPTVLRRIKAAVDEGHWIDAANLAMFAWNLEDD